MIVVKLQGGLGNQLFQYAFARSLSTRLGTDFRLDKAPFDTYYTLHKYSLNHFALQEKLAHGTDMNGFVWLRTKHRFFDTFYKHLRLKRRLMPFYYPERMFHFDPEVFGKDNTYFDGFWQTEKYFKDIADEIRSEIVLKEALSPYSQNIFNEIIKGNAVSLHVRRADYVSDSVANRTFGTCSMEYYTSAIAHIAKHVSKPHFFIFSDDHAWASENFKSLPYPVTCVSNGPEKNYEDLTLMSKCKHHITANSSFSWWGAWLNQSKEKIVIGPKRWFNDVKKGTDTKDILPEEWIKM